MRKYLKRLAALILIPLVQWYLKKERKYSYRGVSIIVYPGVFHPGFFYSTKFLIGYLKEQRLQHKTLLELGCGSGLISIIAAKAGARVTAVDLSSTAIKNAAVNGSLNHVDIEFIKSDLFDNITNKPFDWIIINPPYYARDPKTEAELAWYCGEGFTYFKKLFQSLKNYMLPTTEVIMVLTKGCDVPQIISIAAAAGFRFELLREKKVLFDEVDFLYRISRINSSV